jgi:dipeptidyl aminopeptidase/acylaminoacyl peptidase
MKLVLLTLACLFAVGALAAAAGEKRPLALDDLFRFRRVADPQLSPDGKLVVYVVTAVNLAENSTSSNLWLAPTEGGGEPRRLTTTPKKDKHPRWSPDGKQVLFESNRSGDNQLWVIDVHGGEARQLTSIATEATNGIWSPDGRWVAFVSAVHPEYSEKPYPESNELNKKRKEEAAKNPVKARVFTKLFYRHWDEYVEDKRQHLFVMPAGGGEPRDVTPGDRDAHPTSTTFSSGEEFTFTPDGKALVFTAPPERDEAWSTDYNLYRVPVKGGKARCLTAGNAAADGAPAFSPDSKKLAYRAQKRAGYEADRWEIQVVETDPGGNFLTKPRAVIDPGGFDRSVESFVWGADGTTIYFTADDQALDPVFRLRVADGHVERLVPRGGGVHSSLSLSRDGRLLACVKATMTSPPEVYAYPLPDGKPVNLSRANQQLLGELDLPRPESVTIPVRDGTMQMWVLKPPGFDEGKKWPLAFLVHGGPQGAWEDGWSFRWNPSLWAAQGYVVALPNPRGSTGFGQPFVDQISGDWGGKCFDDLMAGLAFLEKLPYLDTARMAAAGASFGGYMMNWFAGHTDKFKTLISHCGVYNFDSMYATTDELWFDEWEHGGPPWGKREAHEKHSPHRFAGAFKTPMLIIHNDLDFRVPVSEGLQVFTTLQRLGVPSKLINFPDEGHWVLKPANSKYWHEQVFAWLKKYAPPGGREVKKKER